MVIVEKSFPRGGIAKQGNNVPKDKTIFGAHQKKIKSKPHKKVDKRNSKTIVQLSDGIEKYSAELLNYNTLQDGMNLMGLVKSVDQLYLKISLPGRMVGSVSALHISESYTKATSDFLKNSDNSENYKPLTELYKVGQIVYGKVTELKNESDKRGIINFTLKPTEVHSGLVHSNVKKGFIFNGAIEEAQEHGYVIESGIKGLRCFMPLENTNQSHSIGQLVYMKVEKITQEKEASTCICKALISKKLKVKIQNDTNLDYILPSTIVKFNVAKILKDGLQGTIMNETFTAYINEHHLNEPLAEPRNYAIGSTLSARVLYVMPLTKFVYLTLRLDETHVNTDMDLKSGDVVEDAQVHHIGIGGAILVLKNKFKGILSYKSIKTNYRGNYDQDELLVKYAKMSQHKVRILEYDLMDSLYICTNDPRIVNEKYFSITDLQAGQFVAAMIEAENIKVGGYDVRVGRIKGIIEKLYLAPSCKSLDINSQVRCRVLAICPERNVAYLTNRSEYLNKTFKILSTLQDAKENSIFVGTIVQCSKDYILVKFFNNIKGVLHKPRLTGLMSTEVNNFYEGQTMQFRIASKKADKITLALPEDVHPTGEICSVSITHVLETGLEIRIDDGNEDSGDNKGIIPLRLISDYDDLLHAKLGIFQSGDQTQAACIVKNIFSLRDVEYFTANITKDWRSVQPGDILRGFIKNVEGDVIDIMIPIRGYDRLVKVHHKMLQMNLIRKCNLVLNLEQVVYVKVLSKDLATKTLAISAKLIDVWDKQLSSTALYFERYLHELNDIKKAYRKQGIPISSFKLGGKITVEFLSIDNNSQDWHLEEYKTKTTTIIKSSIVGKSQPPKIGEKLECRILWIDYSNHVIFATNKSSDMEHIINSQKIPSNLVGKTGINAKIVLKLDNVFVCSLKKGPNPLIFCPTKLHFNDFENSCSFGVEEGDFCRLALIHDSKPIGVLEAIWKLWKGNASKRKSEEQTITHKTETKKAKLEEPELNKSIETTRKKECSLISNKNELNKKKSATEMNQSQLFYEDKSPDGKLCKLLEVQEPSKAEINSNHHTNAKHLIMPGVTGFWSTDITDILPNSRVEASSDEDDDDVTAQQSLKNKKKLSSVEKFKLQKEEENRLREIEEKYANPKHMPETVDQFDRLVLSEPNNSKHWINYMVFHLQSTEIDKARVVARRALKAISLQNSDELLNIWIALLNLELRYGSKSSYDETFKEALTFNDPKRVYFRAIEILNNMGKKEELIEMISLIIRKFREDQEAWKIAANAYFSIGMTERAQQLLHKALANLPEREHINTIVMFANLNQKHGNNEMAQTLLDQIVTSYPKRVDIWAQYVDLLVKSNLIDSARCVLERAILQKIPLKKMRTIFKKYLEFEERFGKEVDVQKVKKLAEEYVKNTTIT